jgi:hypothetical protein
VVGRREITQIDVRDGGLTATVALPGDVALGAGSADGSVAAVVGERLWIVSLTGEGPARSIDVPDCVFGRPAFADATIFYLPCLGGDLLTVDARRATVTGRRSIVPGLASLTIVPRHDAVLIGDRYGSVYLLSGGVDDGTPEGLSTYGCGAGASRIAISAGATAAVPIGSGTGLTFCGRIGLRTGAHPLNVGHWTFNPFVEPEHTSGVATAAAFNLSGDAFAIAYSNGTVVLHPTEALTPAVTVASVVGAVRDVATTAEGNLLIVTDEGMVQLVSFCDGCVTNAALAQVAAARLARAFELGLAVRPSPAAS